MLKGKPLPAGSVRFFCKELDVSSTCWIKEEGQYVTPRAIQVGDYQVCIGDPPAPGPGGMGASQKAVKVDFPAKYRTFGTSGLKFTVDEKGSNVYDIVLE